MSSLIEFTDQQLLQELLQRATKRDGLALEGHRIDNMASGSYQEVVPVEGHPVPAGCEWKVRDDALDPQEWSLECKSKFGLFDEMHRQTYCWRVPV
jgi:hypothetical protein